MMKIVKIMAAASSCLPSHLDYTHSSSLERPIYPHCWTKWVLGPPHDMYKKLFMEKASKIIGYQKKLEET